MLISNLAVVLVHVQAPPNDLGSERRPQESTRALRVVRPLRPRRTTMKRNPLNAKLTTAMIEELAMEADQNRALRRALLHCVVLLEDAKDPAVRAFVDYLLVEFAPLATAFAEEKHPYLTSVEVMRARLHSGRLAAFLPLDRVRDWLAAPTSPTSTPLPGLSTSSEG